jgi:hypothetical protein
VACPCQFYCAWDGNFYPEIVAQPGCHTGIRGIIIYTSPQLRLCLMLNGPNFSANNLINQLDAPGAGSYTGPASTPDPVRTEVGCVFVCQSLRFRQIHCRVPIEEIERPQLKFVPRGRHNRPVFRARNVVKSKRIPHHDIRIFDWPVGFSPSR